MAAKHHGYGTEIVLLRSQVWFPYGPAIVLLVRYLS
uniref:Uncharacterized protein n=1 Tax=Anguilla anguilla TaxID=7936 RepID=A0A0E9UM05_ANGAN